MLSLAVCSETTLLGHAPLDRIQRRSIKLGPTGYNIPLENWLGLKQDKRHTKPQYRPPVDRAHAPEPKKEKDILL